MGVGDAVELLADRRRRSGDHHGRDKKRRHRPRHRGKRGPLRRRSKSRGPRPLAGSRGQERGERYGRRSIATACPFSNAGQPRISWVKPNRKPSRQSAHMIQRPTEPLLGACSRRRRRSRSSCAGASYLPPPPKGARSWWEPARLRRQWPQRSRRIGRGRSQGLVVTRYGHGVPCERIEIVEAAHPVPDRGRTEAATRIARDGRRVSAPDDLVLCLISGGGSALLAAPADGLTLADKQDTQPAASRFRRADR